MWMPTHVQVTVQKASGLLTKGKNSTNDCFVTISLGKTKYQTSVKEKSAQSVEWHEECELPIPDQGNTAEIILTVLHRNFMGMDEFLGRIAIPLNSLDVYERPRNRWYILESKQGQDSKNKDRGQLEVKIAFFVKSGSLTDLSKKEKHKSSVGQLTEMAQSVGGSLLSITSIEKRKGIKKFAKSIGSKMHLKSKKKDAENDDVSSIGSVGSLNQRPNYKSRQTIDDADPGVVSDEDDFTFDDLSHKSSGSSLNQNNANSGPLGSPPVASLENFGSGDVLRKNGMGNTSPRAKPPRTEVKPEDEWELKLSGKPSKNVSKTTGPEQTLNRKSWESPKLSARIDEEDIVDNSPHIVKENDVISKKSPMPRKKEESMLSKLRKIRRDEREEDIQGAANSKRISNEILKKYEGKSREDLILLVCNMQGEVEHFRKKMFDIEDYLDELLLRVMEATPDILQKPYTGGIIANSKIM